MVFLAYLLLGGAFALFLRSAHPPDHPAISTPEWMIVILLWPLFAIVTLVAAVVVAIHSVREE